MLKNIAPKASNGSVRKARKLRKAMSLPEAMLWKRLRQRPSGLKFRRQHPTGSYILDFFCSDARLAIEVDGIAHDLGDRPALDAARDVWLKKAGIETLRIPAKDVLQDVAQTAQAIADAALSRLPLHHPLRGRSPSPSELGED